MANEGENVMDNGTVVDLKTGDIRSYMYGQEIAEGSGLVDDTVNIPRGEYEDLLEDSLWLRMLEDAGVNNWEGYDEAFRLYDEYNELKENN